MDPSARTRILLVDDSPANLVALESALASPEYELVKASSGAEALRFLLREDCALILMDVQMPELDGYETARLIRGNARTRTIPIVFLTAFGVEEEHVQRGYASGAIDYLFKPLVPGVLRSKVASFAALHLARQQVVAQEAQLREAQRREHVHTLAEIELRNLRRQEAGQRRYRWLVNGISHAVAWIADPVTLAPRFVSPSVQFVLGRDADGWLSNPAPLPDRVHPEDRAAFSTALASLVPGQDGRRLLHRMPHASGQERWFDTALRLLPSEEGESLEIHGFSVDVTEPLRARQVLSFLAEAGDALSRSLECAETAEAVARLAVPVVADWSAVEVFPAEAGEQVSATSPDPEPPETVRALAAMQELPLRSRGRSLGVLRLFRGPGRPPPGAREQALAEELARRAAQAIDNALLYRAAREAIKAREDFLAIASHELRTPLATLTLQLRLLERLSTSGRLRTGAAGSGNDLHRRVRNSLSQVDRLTTLVHSLLDLARIRSGRLDLQLESCDLGELAREVAARFEDTLAADDRSLDVTTCEGAVGQWDRSRLDQVVTNLVSNAVKYGGTGAIHVVVALREGRAALTVRDEGPGIPPEELGRMFEQFARGAGATGKGGLGLGLFISRSIVEAHGGTILVQSRPGDGTTFTLDLPVDRAPETDDLQGAAHPAHEESTPGASAAL